MRWLALLASTACVPTSELTIRLIVDDAAFEAVELPSRVIIDYANGQYRGIDFCEFEGQEFLELEVPPVVYRECRSATVVRGALIHHDESEAPCITGRIDEHPLDLPAEELWAGYGEVVVFDTDTCGVIQDATLYVEGL